MRTIPLNYDEELALARKSRAIFALNSGFADQLWLWEQMGHSIFEKGGIGPRKINPRYEEWRPNRGVLLTKDLEIKDEI